MTRLVLLVSAAWVVGPHVVFAQGTLGSAPRGGVFGVAPASPRGQLEVIVAFTEALDSEAPPETLSLIPQQNPGGYSTMFSAAADYERTRQRTRVAGSADTAFRRYQQLDRVSALSQSAALGARVDLARRTTFEVNQTAAYAPSFFFSLFPSVVPPGLGEAVPPSPGLPHRRSAVPGLRHHGNLGHRDYSRSQRKHFGRAQHDLIQSSQSERSARPNQDILTGRAKWSHGFGRTGVLSAEYEYREGDFGYGANATDQRLRFGVEYFPALSTSRRLALRFHIAPSAMEIPESVTGAGATETLYRLEGDAAVVYPFSLGWDLGVSYQRGVEYIAVLREPVFRDVTRLEMTGLLGRRVDVSASAGFFVGQSALSMNSEHFDTYTGTTRARYSVSRSLAVYAEYLYYYYNLQGQASLAPDLPDVFEQHGIRAGLMLWARPVGR